MGLNKNKPNGVGIEIKEENLDEVNMRWSTVGLVLISVALQLTEIYADITTFATEEDQVMEAIRSFETRFSFRDVISLTGYMEEDTTYSPTGPRQPINRKFVTTAEYDYSVEERRMLRAELTVVFRKIPDPVRIYFQPHEILDLKSDSAQVKVMFYFRDWEFTTPWTEPFVSLPATPLTLKLRKITDRWLVADLADITARVADIVNLIPILLNYIPDQRLRIDGDPFVRNLTEEPPVFNRREDIILSFTASSSPDSIVEVSVTEDTLRIIPLAIGEARITLTADNNGIKVTTSFDVTVYRKPKPSPDFNGNGQVEFQDFLLFAQAFGSWDEVFDLDEDGQVGFSDFILFAQAFGQ